MSLQDDIQRGIDAKRILDDPALVKAFQDVEDAITQAWRTSPLRDKEGQLELRLMMKLLGDLRANLEQALVDGKLASEELKINEQRKSPIQKLRSILR